MKNYFYHMNPFLMGFLKKNVALQKSFLMGFLIKMPCPHDKVAKNAISPFFSRIYKGPKKKPYIICKSVKTLSLIKHISFALYSGLYKSPNTSPFKTYSMRIKMPAHIFFQWASCFFLKMPKKTQKNV